MKQITSMKAQWQAVTKSGESLNFEECRGGYFSDEVEWGLKLIGKTFQNGEECVKMGTKVYIRGKNLIDLTKHNFSQGGIAFKSNDDYSITVTGVATDYAGIVIRSKLPVIKGQTYYLSNLIPNNINLVYQWMTYDATGNTILQNKTVKGGKIVIGENDRFLTVTIKRHNTDNALINYTIYPQLEFGKVPTEYELPILYSYIVAPCNLYEGDIFYSASGKVIRRGGSIEQYDTQPISIPVGTVNITQVPKDLSGTIEATVLTRREQECTEK